MSEPYSDGPPLTPSGPQPDPPAGPPVGPPTAAPSGPPETPWQRLDPRMLDPLAFDSHSQIGVPGLVDAYVEGQVVIANAPGAGVLESPAVSAFLPALARHVTGEALRLPNIATWWCGGARQAAHVADHLDTLLIAPAFGPRPLGLPAGARPGASLSPDERAALLADMARRPQDYVGQEIVRLSTMPVVIGA